MMDTRKMAPAEIRRAAMRAVIREVGAAGLARLLHDEIPGRGNYQTDREQWLPEFASIEEMMKLIEAEGAPPEPVEPPKANS